MREEGPGPGPTPARTTHLNSRDISYTLSGLAAAGSWLLTDAVSESFLVSAQRGGFLAMMAANGSPFQFGTDDPATLMAGHGWTSQVTRFGEPDANFGRWTLPESYVDEPNSPHGYLIVAHR